MPAMRAGPAALSLLSAVASTQPFPYPRCAECWRSASGRASPCPRTCTSSSRRSAPGGNVRLQHLGICSSIHSQIPCCMTGMQHDLHAAGLACCELHAARLARCIVCVRHACCSSCMLLLRPARRLSSADLCPAAPPMPPADKTQHENADGTAAPAVPLDHLGPKGQPCGLAGQPVGKNTK